MTGNNVVKDIFISYKNDGEGSNFAARLCDDLTRRGFSVYYNPHERKQGEFPKLLRKAVGECSDLLLILSQGCIDWLKKNEDEDWVRDEILHAKTHGKNIVPLLIGKAELPNRNEMPDKLKFLMDLDIYQLPEHYIESPIVSLLGRLQSKAGTNSLFMNEKNSSDIYDVSKDFEETLAEARKGSQKAMYKVANMYFYGFSNEDNTTDRNFKKAHEWFKKAVSQEGQYKAYADSMLGRMYYDGTVPGEKQSYKKALTYHKKSADNSEKYGYSATRVAFMQQYARGCEFDFDEVERYYLSLLEKGDDVLKMNLGDFYADYGQFKKAAEMYMGMENFNPDAAYKLGMLYKKGVLENPMRPDYLKAFYYFYMAINGEFPHAEAANQLGLLFFAPTGEFRKDFKMAKHYFEIAADLGSGSAQYMLGYMYELGYVEKDLTKAKHYFTMAANQGDVNSLHHLAMIYQQSECKDYYKACKYAELSANAGISEGEFIYANMLYMGRGCTADEAKAYEYYKLARAHGMEQAEFMIEKIEQQMKVVAKVKTDKTVFISYHAGTSEHLVEEIVKKLEYRGIKCWSAGGAATDDFAGSIVRAINTCSVFLLLLDKVTSESGHVLNEMHLVNERVLKNDNVVVLPVHIANDEISLSMQYYVNRMPIMEAVNESVEETANQIVENVERIINK